MKHFIVPIFIFSVLILLASCDQLDDLTKSKYDREKEKIKGEWMVDTIRTITYASILSTDQPEQIIVEKDSISTEGKMSFSLTTDDAQGGILIQEYPRNGANETVQMEWTAVFDIDDDGVKQMIIYYLQAGTTDCYCDEVYFDVTSLSDNSLRLYRYAARVDIATGVRTGYTKSIIKLSK